MYQAPHLDVRRSLSYRLAVFDHMSTFRYVGNGYLESEGYHLQRLDYPHFLPQSDGRLRSRLYVVDGRGNVIGIRQY